ncbi:hypothetical protein [Brachybacterium kimchii]|uniref:Phage head morphogenesis domain-containing protein n=1 Tax=Brachybacterium kimchii TaxID=2942909 RepID=A0ABY4NBA9_9MICO|nr:hypothetical protein [Brachybacterium kimchii]UQN30664.1 hypothetical protein M4486_05005 [Brachybacterium kimchii]
MTAAQVAVLVAKSATARGRLLEQLVKLLLKVWDDDREAMYDPDRVLARAAGSADLVEDAIERAFRTGYEFPRMSRRVDGLYVPDGPALEVPGYVRDGVSVLDVYQRPAEQYRYWISVQERQDELAKLLRDDPRDAGRRIEAFLPALDGTAEHAEAERLVTTLRGVDELEQAADALEREQVSLAERRVSDADAHGKATERAEVLADDDVSLARRAGTRAGLRSIKATKYRRVIHPELSKSGTCGLCVAASTQVYSVDQLMPIHDRCRCEQVEVRPGADYGQQFNDADLKAIYEAGVGTSAEDLKAVRFEITDNGELGAIIAPKRQAKPTRASKPATSPKTPSLGLDDQLSALRAALAAVDDNPKATDIERGYLRRRIQRVEDAVAKAAA